ncbi:SCO3242 family prenyltransferase [Streptomyces sp. 4N509B]|uniref:SCO3242 family prenyltransferase n=1 Tax=Streptomyces sp. 4N509B TaxID=3457413 RepID=UPI003FD07F73
MTMTPRDLAELIRAPAALTLPGDSLAGSAAAGFPYGRRTWLTPLASACLYWAGMALNDYADRELDRAERPERPIPSGRVRPGQALALAAGLTGGGLALAAAAGGRPAVRVAVPLAATVWTYDLLAKDTPAGPATMALARGLDVLLGAATRPRAAALPALAVATHTVGLTTLSRGEVHGTSRATARVALAATSAAAAAAAWPARAAGSGTVAGTGPDAGSWRRGRAVAALLATGCAATYAATVGRAQLAAARSPDAATVRRATGAGIRGLIPLQSALLARVGQPALAAAVLAAGPVARAASKVVSPT